ncbi:3-alpha-hydroxycholanate dehydrogenase (NADP(+)) [Zhongshania aliphaticivorans]|uniref:3-alpha-hydroxycholanate dehydrogenase (NADP(+)) n=1 Tax=Zhongshania aliphaticivorans TaxID=1470434 RepID=A0A5S9MYN9_9GAMM|nr:SDR family oxidoreductase [Zhongshania aliphaticivorans]CAA0082022.1 3-alpha-hydroxycholanate dehydrogenase (NADP(+)) [Zhongshania aliphaticivorans]CAA0084516.1 3-alpha-hydroxycholanate dehydrogenase (NADP(+)) [Zhongshania aliphaticivorans]
MKTVVITGSTRGIGRGLAENFLKLGCLVVISGRQQAVVDQTVAQLKTLGSVSGLACDISNSDDLQALWEHAQAHSGVVDIWINNAGMSIKKQPLDLQAVSDIQNIVSTNLTGLLLACRVAMIGMKKQGQGQIWNMEGFGSNGAAQPGMASYGATKRAVNYLNKALRKDVAGSGVQICTLSPGIVVTDLLVGDYDTSSPEWQKSKRIFNILGDKVNTVTPWLAKQVLASHKDGSTVAWLTTGKAFYRFLTASFNKRDLFTDIGV